MPAGADEFEVAVLPGEAVVERKAHQLEIGRARADIEHVLNQDLIRQWLFLLGDVVLQLAELALAEARDAIFQHPLAIEHRHLTVGPKPLDQRGFQIGVGRI